MTLSVDLFFSFRSPYSYLALPKTLKLVEEYDLAVKLRPVYPIEKVKPEDFFSKKDIDNAKSRMVGWVNSLSKTGR